MASPPHLVHIFPTFATGGIQTVMLRVVNALGARYRHTVLSLDGRLDAASRLAPGVPVELHDARGVTGLGARRDRLTALRPDLVLTYNWGSMDWVAAHVVRRLCPHLHAEHGFGLDEAFRRHPRRNWTRRLLLRRVDALVVPSRSLEDLARREWWLPERRVVFVANGVETRSAPVRRPVCGIVTIGTLAPLRAEKRIDRLLAMVDRLPDEMRVRLVVGGDGPERAALEAAVAGLRHRGRVQLSGHVDDPAAFLAGLDIFALTSATEQMPAAVLEAMAAGLPVVAFAAGDVREMVAAANRPYIVPEGNEAAFVAALTRLLGAPEERLAIGTANRDRQQRMFTVERMAGAYDELWQRHLATVPRSRG